MAASLIALKTSDLVSYPDEEDSNCLSTSLTIGLETGIELDLSNETWSI